MTATTKTPSLLITLIAVQAFCAVFFLTDVVADIAEDATSIGFHIIVESVAVVTLVIAIAVETKALSDLARRGARLEQSLKQANSAVFEVIESCFEAWHLSPAEHDVATFVVKGFSIDEIAELRGNKPGTIKAHLNNIYRKSDSRNRAELMATLVDTLVGARGAEQEKPRS